jgi:acetylornithine/succinyldiaminopimelate/putrescine aminotransferase
MYGGHAVAVAGHCHPRVVEALVAQAGRLMFYSNAVDIPVRRELCERLLTWDRKTCAPCSSATAALKPTKTR